MTFGGEEKGAGRWGPPHVVATFDQTTHFSRPGRFGSPLFLCSRNCHPTHTHVAFRTGKGTGKARARADPARGEHAEPAPRPSRAARTLPCRHQRAAVLGSSGHSKREAVLPAGRKKGENVVSRVALGGFLALALSGLVTLHPQEEQLTVRTVLVASFHARAVTRICEISGTFGNGHVASHEAPSKLIISGRTVRVLGEKSSAPSPPMLREVELSFTFSGIAVSRSVGIAPTRKYAFVTGFPVFGSQVRLHQPPTKEKGRAVNLLVTRTSMPASSVPSSFSPPLPWLKLCSCPVAFFPRPLRRKQC